MQQVTQYSELDPMREQVWADVSAVTFVSNVAGDYLFVCFTHSCDRGKRISLLRLIDCVL